MACCSLLSSPSLLTLQSGSSAHSTTGKLFTFFASWVFYPVVGSFKAALSPMQGTWCTGKRGGIRKTLWDRLSHPLKVQAPPPRCLIPPKHREPALLQVRMAMAALVAAGLLREDGIDYGCLKSFGKLAQGEKEGRSSQVGLIPL